MKNLICLIIFVFLTNVNYAQNLDSGCVGKWLFTGNALDSSGNGNHGIVYRSTLTTDRFVNNNAAYNFTHDSAVFGQRNCEVYIPYNSVLNVNRITISAWVFPRSYYWPGNSNHESEIIARHENISGQVFRMAFDDISVSVSLSSSSGGSGANVTSSYVLTLNSWSHIVFTYDNNYMKLYVNDSLRGSLAYSGAMNTTGNSGISIGELRAANGYWYHTNGKIDDIRIYNRALSQSEIIMLYNQVPSQPTLISPSNNSLDISLTPTLVWNTISGATGYKVKVSTDSTFTTITDSSTVTTNQYSIPSGKLNYNQKYYWKIAGYNAYGVGQYSVIWNFTTLNPLPLLVTLLSPSNGSSNVTLTPTLFWNTSTNSSNYRVQVSPSNTFSYIVDSATVSTNQRTIPSGKLNVATTYYWRVQGANSYGTGPWSSIWNFFTIITGISQIGTEIPKEFKLYENYPNPFNPTTSIKYDIANSSFVKLKVYDVIGKEVESLVNGNLQAGKYEATFNGGNYSSGMYFAKIEAGSYMHIIKLVMIK